MKGKLLVAYVCVKKEARAISVTEFNEALLVKRWFPLIKSSQMDKIYKAHQRSTPETTTPAGKSNSCQSKIYHC